MAYKLEQIIINTQEGPISYKKLSSSDVMTEFKIAFKHDSPLHHSIQMVSSYSDITNLLRLVDTVNIDALTAFDITHLFLCLQYSIINDNLKLVFKKIVEKKIKEKTSFTDFIANMNLVKYRYKSSYDDYMIKIKNWIGEDSMKIIFG